MKNHTRGPLRHHGTQHVPGETFNGRDWVCSVVSENGRLVARAYGADQFEAEANADMIVAVNEFTEMAEIISRRAPTVVKPTDVCHVFMSGAMILRMRALLEGGK